MWVKSSQRRNCGDDGSQTVWWTAHEEHDPSKVAGRYVSTCLMIVVEINREPSIVTTKVYVTASGITSVVGTLV